MPLSDEQLAQKCRRDPRHFDPIVKRYAEKIRRYIARLIGNWQEAEDLTQDVFVKAYTNIASFNPKLKFSSWIYRIAHNESVNYIKKNYRYKTVEFSEEIKNHLTENRPIYKKILEQENSESVQHGLRKLQARQREIIELFYFEQKSYLEIADILLISVNSVGPLIKRAKNKLKKIIEEYDQTGR